MEMESRRIRYIAEAGVIAAVYTAVTMIFAPISFGQSGIDVRISEALTVLPMFTPAAVPGLTIGCVLSNCIGGGVILDVIFGSAATLIGAVGTRMLRKKRYLAPIPPVVSNTLIVPFILRHAYGVNLPIPLLMLSVGIGEAISAYGLGQLLITALNPRRKALFGEENS